MFTSNQPNYPPGWQILFSPAGWVFLRRLQQARSEGASFLELNKKLRDWNAPLESVAPLLAQVELQEKAQKKFGNVSVDMLFTASGLEQSSRMSVAKLHAMRFASANISKVTDLGCGIGSQSLAFVKAGLEVHSVEIDELTAAVADHNLKLVAKSAPGTITISFADATEIALSDDTAVFLDPARRTAGHKNTSRVNANDYSPSLEFAFETARNQSGAVKLGPGFLHDMIPSDAEPQWISAGGDVLENVLWFGAAKRPGVKASALVLKGERTNPQVHELVRTEEPQDANVREVGAYLYEPDGATIRARLVGEVASIVGGGMLDPRIAYITSNEFIQTPFAVCFKLLEEAPVNVKQLSKFLSNRKIGTLEIKKRGVDVDPQTLRKKLSLKGPNNAALIMTRIGDERVAYLAERI